MTQMFMIEKIDSLLIKYNSNIYIYREREPMQSHGTHAFKPVTFLLRGITVPPPR